MKYLIDWKKFIEQLLPNDLTNGFMLQWLLVLTKPFRKVHDAFLVFRKAIIYELTITPQVCYLEKLLNDRFDFTDRRIYIDDGVDKPPKYIYVNAELKPQFIRRRAEASPVFIYTRSEIGALSNDFIVFIPLTLMVDLNEVVSVLKSKKLLGTKFKIQRF
ncbi:hypothetical protein ACFOWM_06325 [Ferruginibacter yonginensis]|uniref:Uncharacterized protein n=1 Tax=Ferruginibacter yonginensis TaxID=1310416 RepID=A0ABV8QSY0_9BACT